MKIDRDPAASVIPWARPAIDQTELEEVIACMQSGWLTSGPRVERFEQQMAHTAGRRFGVAVSNGTAALDLALRVLGIGPGDEVIVPAFSYVATASTVAIVGATPVFVDVDRRNLGMDPAHAAAKIAPRTAALLCTDHGGNPCDYAALTSLADRHGLPLIVDGAQSIGATYAGRPCLSYGTVSTTSFHAAKTITTIEGGMVFTDDAAVARQLRIIRSQGEDPQQKYHHIELGHNFRMTELQAAIGLAQLSKLPALLNERRKLADVYRAAFAAHGLSTPAGVPDAGNGNFLSSVLVPDRDAIMKRLKQRGIETRACYPLTLPQQPIFRHLAADPCPVAERAAASILNPPLYHGLSPVQQRRVVNELISALSASGQELRKAV